MGVAAGDVDGDGFADLLIGAFGADGNAGNSGQSYVVYGRAVADLAMSKDDGVTSATPGGAVTYTIVASNAGPSDAAGAIVLDGFPVECASTSFTSVASGGASGNTPGPSADDINDTLSLPAGSSVTYTATCNVPSDASGSLVNTATIAAAGGVIDPASANNSATDSDTLSPQADLQVTKTDGATTAAPGGTVTYTIVASNAGPNGVTGATVTDAFPTACTTVSYTSVAAGGATGNTAGPAAGNISDTVDLPAGSSVTYTATCTISAAATNTLANTATVASAVTDPAPGNNSATDTDTLPTIFKDGFETGDTSRWSS
jgi:uncharacterized repeat protein (TIGR01451 family)